MDEPDLVGHMRLQARACRALGSPFYGELLERLAASYGRSALPELLEPYRDAALSDAVALRLLGGLQRLALSGRAPELARHFPSTGGDGDAAAALGIALDVAARDPVQLRDVLRRPPQTNEVGRSVALIGGFLTVAREAGLPLRVLELGASAGLNLRFDRYWYEAAGSAFGDPGSPVRFVDLWDGAVPPFDATLEVAARRGCDRDPIDVTTDDGRLTLLSYVWPGQTERFELLRAALDVARRAPVAIDREGIPRWLDRQLRDAVEGCATVVFHSVVWQYLDEAERASVNTTMARAGSRATVDAPVAWLRLEPAAGKLLTELRVTTWPGGEECLLATAGFHLGRVRWLDRP